MEAESCPNIDNYLGCDRCPEVEVEWSWGGTRGKSCAILGSVKCTKSDIELVEGDNYSEGRLPPPRRG